MHWLCLLTVPYSSSANTDNGHVIPHRLCNNACNIYCCPCVKTESFPHITLCPLMLMCANCLHSGQTLQQRPLWGFLYKVVEPVKDEPFCWFVMAGWSRHFWCLWYVNHMWLSGYTRGCKSKRHWLSLKWCFIKVALPSVSLFAVSSRCCHNVIILWQRKLMQNERIGIYGSSKAVKFHSSKCNEYISVLIFMWCNV